MKYSDIFQKSEIGRDEIKNHSIGVLPREARTLLIMIDGKRTYQNYIETLDQSKMFASFGGVTPLFELLWEFECIEVVDHVEDSVASTVPKVPIPAIDTRPSTPNSEAEFERTFNTQMLDDLTSIASASKRKTLDTNYDRLKSSLATYIEKNAPPQEAWGYLLNLEQCDDSAQLKTLAQDIKSSGNEKLAQGMDNFIKQMSH